MGAPGGSGRITVLQIIAHADGNAAHRSVGGAERWALEALDHWDYSRFRLVVTYSREGRLRGEFEAATADHPSITLLDVPAPRRRDWRSFDHFRRAIRWHGVDVVHSQGPHGTDWWGALAARAAGAASVVTRPIALSAYRLRPRTHYRFLVLDRFALARSSMVFVSEHERAEAVRIRETAPSRSQVVLNGVDLARFRPVARPPGQPPAFGMVGQLVPAKDWDTFLGACEHVFAAIPDSRALIVGDGPEYDRIAGIVAERGWAERVHMVGFSPDVTRHLAAMDVFVLASIREGLPIAIIEAMAMARPVVATDVGGNREIVREGRTGHLVPVGDAPALADRIIRLLRDDALRARFGAAARADAERRLSIGAMVRAYERLYVERVRDAATSTALHPAIRPHAGGHPATAAHHDRRSLVQERSHLQP